MEGGVVLSVRVQILGLPWVADYGAVMIVDGIICVSINNGKYGTLYKQQSLGLHVNY